MFNLGFTELLVLAIIGLLVLGPEQLPIVARKLAKILNQLKHAVDDAMSPVNDIKKSTTEYMSKAQDEVFKVEDDINKSIEGHKEKEPDEEKKGE